MREEELGVAAVLEDEAVEQYHELDSWRPAADRRASRATA
jgi:hypothetical protein